MDRSNKYKLLVKQDSVALEHTYFYFETPKEQPKDVLHEILVKLNWYWGVIDGSVVYSCKEVVDNKIVPKWLELDFIPKSPDSEHCFKCVVSYNSKYVCSHSLLAANTNSELRNGCRDVEAILSDWNFVKVVLGVIGLDIEIVYEK